MVPALDVAVVGIGTAGASAALLLARLGHRVAVLERVEDPAPVGAGVMLQPTGLWVLEKIDASAEVVSRGARVDRLVSRTKSGRTILDLNYASLGPIDYAHPVGLGVHRGVLFRELLTRCRRVATVRTGVDVRELGPLRRQKRTLVDEHGAEIGTYDLVLVCDGARSRIRRSQTEVPACETPYPWGALWAIAEDPDGKYAGCLSQTVDGTAQMIGLLPMGRGPDTEVPLVSLFVSVPVRDVPLIRAAGYVRFRERVLRLCPEAEPVFAGVERRALDEGRSPMDAFTLGEYHDVVMPRWHAEGVAFLGDAAHATSPQLGQGCNLALCDAWTLGCAMATSPDLSHALLAYTGARRDHLAYYQLATRWLTPFFQSHLRPLGALRDSLMGPFARVPWVHREMVRTMAGIKTGALWGEWDRGRAPLRLQASEDLPRRGL